MIKGWFGEKTGQLGMWMGLDALGGGSAPGSPDNRRPWDRRRARNAVQPHRRPASPAVNLLIQKSMKPRT